ncbi:site-specific integrase [Caballeronia sp. EK]|uniref:site-specific integrase n=1 Tax=Caballeronia sp. EK TaxID=2767469 RepID=UPI0016565688|nr:site-specific integrase [Caballeronia sp. EK]MBC8639950.1 site-specific integrase [Caballeronia sp. EK]
MAMLLRVPLREGRSTDQTYANYWATLLWGFEEFYNNQVSREDFVQFVYLSKTQQEAVPDYAWVDVSDLRAIHTPHSCRATYATNRTGLLEMSDIALQLGHESTVVTAHYAVSTSEIIAEKLAYADRMMLADFGLSVVRPDKPESALRQGFQRDRDATIRDFMFAPAVALWSIDELSKTNGGLDALRKIPMSEIVFRETHICPVGEACPSEVVEKLGAPKRCGMCPLAMKCVDHLPGIAAKMNQLKMRVRVDIRRAEALDARGEPEAVVDALYEAAESDANEIVGWQLSHDILLQMRRGQSGSTEYHVQAPEVVQKHLDLVTTDRKMSEFLLQRIVEADAYPSLADPEIQRIADRFHRLLMGASVPDAVDDPVASLAGLIRTQLAPRGLTLKDLANYVDHAEQRYVATLPVLFVKSSEQFAQTGSEL